MARLLKKKTSVIQADRIGAALGLVEGYGYDMVVALKGGGNGHCRQPGHWALTQPVIPGMVQLHGYVLPVCVAVCSPGHDGPGRAACLECMPMSGGDLLTATGLGLPAWK